MSNEVYAKGTKVPVERTRMEIEALLTKHKATSTMAVAVIPVLVTTTDSSPLAGRGRKLTRCI